MLGDHTLSSHHLRLRSWQPHHDPAIGHGFNDEREEGRARAAESRAGVHVLFAEDEGFADLAEDPGDEGLLCGWEGGSSGDYGH